MTEYRLSRTEKDDLIRIHQYGVDKFGVRQADKYFNTFFVYFDKISEHPFSFESVDFIKPGYRRCVCGADIIFYKLNNNVIEIMAIVGCQDLDGVL